MARQGERQTSKVNLNEVIETAQRTVAQQLRTGDARGLVGDLPPGEPHKIRKPDGPPASWPELVPTAGRRAA